MLNLSYSCLNCFYLLYSFQGLNAILDHRAEVYIPELNQTFACPPSFRIFACQNPSSQGGGRKGLPKSFLNRFTKVRTFAHGYLPSYNFLSCILNVVFLHVLLVGLCGWVSRRRLSVYLYVALSISSETLPFKADFI